eukprot:978756-Amphidinium_carterae.1
MVTLIPVPTSTHPKTRKRLWLRLQRHKDLQRASASSYFGEAFSSSSRALQWSLLRCRQHLCGKLSRELSSLLRGFRAGVSQFSMWPLWVAMVDIGCVVAVDEGARYEDGQYLAM